MSILKKEDSTKWINTLVALGSVLVGVIVIRFMGQMGEWFDLEAKVKYFLGVSQGVGILAGFSAFMIAKKHRDASAYLNEVYNELLKVVWPDRDSVTKVTVGIVIALVFVSAILILIDFVTKILLGLLY